MKKRVVYYTDELNDDFSGVKRDTLTIDGEYVYIKKNIFWKISAWIVRRIFVIPFAYVYMKIKFRHKVIGKEKLKDCKHRGYFMYSNHTLMAGDAFIPNIISRKKVYTVVHPDNISIKFVGEILKMSGAIPTPSTISATKNFVSAVEKLSENNVIQIYPEAHVWPYYTGIRKFKSTSFKYPCKLNSPVYVLTNTFKKRKFSKTPQVVSYIDGPFYPEEGTQKEQEQKLASLVYETMGKRSKNNNYEVIQYIKRENND